MATIPGYRQSSVQPVPAIGSAAVAALRAQADAIQVQPLRRYGQSGQAAPRPALVGTAAVAAMQAQANEIGQRVYGIARPPSQPFNPPALPAPNPQLHPIPQQPPQPLPAPQPPQQPPIPPGRLRIIEPVAPHDLGPMNIVCPNCDALHWKVERLQSSTNRQNIFGDCCLSGKVQLPKLQPVPRTLRHLLEGQGPEAKQFHQNIRQYNSAFTFTSLGATFDQSLLQGNGPYVLRLHGELYHNHGALLPNDGAPPAYAQLYIYDPAMALQQRMQRNAELSPTVMSDLQEMLLECNPFVNLYRQAAQRLRDQGQNNNIQARLTYKSHTDPRRYNIPTADEIAVILPGDGMAYAPRDIVVQLRGGGFKKIFDTNPVYAPLHYVLLFPRGELGWHPDIPYHGDEAVEVQGEANRQRHVTQIQYYAYHLFQRQDEAKTLLLGGKLLQQYIVDSWAAAEQSRLRWIKTHQSTLWSELYNQVVDANNLGRKFILPASFQEGYGTWKKTCRTLWPFLGSMVLLICLSP